MGPLLRLREPLFVCMLFAFLFPAQCATELQQVTFGPVAELGPQCSPDNRWIAFEYFHETSGSHGPQIWIMAESEDFTSAKPKTEEHTSELQSRGHLVCRLLLEKKKTTDTNKSTESANEPTARCSLTT